MKRSMRKATSRCAHAAEAAEPLEGHEAGNRETGGFCNT